MSKPSGPAAPDISWRTVALVGAASVAVSQGFSRFTYGLMLPTMTDELIGSYNVAGSLATANLGAYLLGVIVVSSVCAFVQPARLIAASLAMTVVGNGVMASAQGLGTLLLGMTMMGFFAAGTWVPMAAVVSSVVPARNRGLALGAVIAGPGVGIVLGGQIASAVTYWTDGPAWREVWAIQTTLGAIIVVICWRTMRRLDHVPLAPSGFAGTVLRQVPRWWALVGAYSFYGLGYMVFLTYLVTTLEIDAGFSRQVAAAAYSTLGFASIFGGLLLGRLSDRIGRRATLFIAATSMSLCTVAVVLGATPLVFLAAVAFGLAFTGTGAVTAAYIGDHLQGASVGAAFGALTVVFGSMQMIGPLLAGWAADQSGSFIPSFLAAALSLGLAATLTLGLRPSPAPRPRPGGAR